MKLRVSQKIKSLIIKDSFLRSLVTELVEDKKCHTVILYGSHARGCATEQSDYDLMGVQKTGKKYRIAEKRDGKYVDLFVFTEKTLKKLDESHLYMSDGVVLYQEGDYGSNFLKRLRVIQKRKYKAMSSDEIRVRQIWLHKMYDRARQNDIEGNYRRSWLQEALLYKYFNIRRLRYCGSRKSFEWLKRNDPRTYKLFSKSLANPTDMRILKNLVNRVSLLKS